MFSKILIANRGEIACRIIQTAKKLKIKTVAVYSEIDSDSLHRNMADEAIYIGASQATESYLLSEKIIAACKQTGAEAVHPGYGFLSENSMFCSELIKNNIIFIGPDPTAIEAMGDKIKSKKIAEEAGVTIVPGHSETILDVSEAVSISEKIGYPVMLKASAGGGGKGMRIAHNSDEVKDGFERARSEARSSFADDRIFIEKFIQEPRHIEIQIIADKKGNTVYLGERECSIQRRHQKVLEEAPSSFLDTRTRHAMGKQAVLLSKAVNYEGAGTVEFIVDSDQNFFFLEMNTRIQVEHPVTEAITGFDIVELMIRVASGESLQIRQEDVKLEGHAIEARLYAEDTTRNFLPSTGRLVRYQAPEVIGQKVRIDTGVCEGTEISIFYDPMIAKLITHGKTRTKALQTMRDALDNFFISGIETNLQFLRALTRHPKFIRNEVSTSFISNEYPLGSKSVALSDEDEEIVCIVSAYVHGRFELRASQISGQMAEEAFNSRNEWIVIFEGKEKHLFITDMEFGFEALFEKRIVRVETEWKIGELFFKARVQNTELSMSVIKNDISYEISYAGYNTRLFVMSPKNAELNRWMRVKPPPNSSKSLQSPMPGLLIEVLVAAGMAVKAGEKLCIIEAMKMENILRAERDFVVHEIKAHPGDILAVDQVILTFE